MHRHLTLAAIAAVALAALPAVVGGQAAAGQASFKNPASLKETAPATYKAEFDTSAGKFVVEVHRDWAPIAADRFFNMVKSGFYDDCRFFRVVPNFMVQFGMSGDTTVSRVWRDRSFADDTVTRGNARGKLSFATGGPNTRTTQLFINRRDNQRLDSRGFSVAAQVVAGMDVVDSLYQGYGEGAPRGKGPSQDRIAKEGEAYLAKDFPLLDKIVTARVVVRWR